MKESNACPSQVIPPRGRGRLSQEGLTLTEVMIAAVILAMCVIPVIGIFITGKQNVVRTDDQRRARHYLQAILARADRASLHVLWNYFGPKGYPKSGTLPNVKATGNFALGKSGAFEDRIADYDPSNGKITTGPVQNVNPLGFTEDFLKELAVLGMEGQLHFEFFSRKGLMIHYDADDPTDTVGSVNSKIGILHMQAGWMRARLVNLKTKEIMGEEIQNIMCPAIVGRPGLKLSSCPAINPEVHSVYHPILAEYEDSELAAQGNPW